ncbi:NnrS family protein [Pseudohalocynthiibacter aestuariivivens]|nr:NnrS family protein [Pseudohalocynthiibacter aestuariivivens]QIE44971.1 NnrS family protein [Pseudohalocynthiibacter aestuariivivens]
MSARTKYSGPALFSYGFRPFFLSATLFALLVVPVWWLVWRGDVVLSSTFSPTDWHIHEMVFGYGAAVIAGFLFTAVPNWTGRLPAQGWPLAALLAIWIAGRLALAGATGLGPIGVAAIDQLFLVAVAGMIAREIIAGKNWRNLKVLIPVTLLWLANLAFHIEAMTQGGADVSRRAGIALLIFLIMLIGGRVVPSFTRNWLVKRGATGLPVPFNRFDGLTLLVSVLALLIWVAAPFSIVNAASASAAAGVQVIRLLRWQGMATWRSPLLVMLHVAYLLIPAGFLGIAGGALGIVSPAVGAHLFGIGAVGGMTVAVMMRATLGHTGRDLVAGPMLTIAFALLMVSAVLRAADGTALLSGVNGVGLSAVCWTAAFAVLVLRIGPWLATPNVSRRKPSGGAQ